MGQMSELHIKMQDELMNTVHRAENGEISMLDAFIQIEEERKQLENSLAIVKSFKDVQIDSIAQEYENYPDGYKGFVVEKRNGGRSFDYKHIEEWKQKNDEVKACEEKYKQAFIAMEKGLLTASEDGEELTMPIPVYRKSSIILKTKKQ